TLVNGPTITAGSNPPGNSIAPGTYLPAQSFAGLLGSPLNGDWCIRVTDHLSIDNGYIFSWGLEFDPNLQPPELSFTPVITSESWDADPSITNTTGSTITVQPATEGVHCYTYRVMDDFDCEYTEQVCITVLPEIVTETPNNLFLCNPGAPPYIFDLTQNTPVVTASATNAGDLVVTYHNSQADADADTGAIGTAGAYSGTDGEVVYIRIEYLNSGCYETSSFTLNITPEPTINAVGDLVQCDDPSNDGVADFDLESQTLTILGAQPSSDFTVTYYSSQASADAGTGALSSPYSSSGEPIWVRVELASDANCSNVSVGPLFDLVLNPVPEILPASQSICDNVLPGDDGFGEFDLTLSETSILNGLPATDYTITYYEDTADAETGPGSASEILTSGAYGNTTATTQTVH